MKIVELEQEAMMGEFEDYILNEAIDRADGISPQVWGDEEILTAPITFADAAAREVCIGRRPSTDGDCSRASGGCTAVPCILWRRVKRETRRA